MAQSSPFRRNGERRDLKKAAGLAGRYLDRTRPRRLARRPKSPFGFKFFLLFALTLFGAFSVVMFGEAAAAFAASTTDLPPVSDLSAGMSFKTTRILDRNGNLLYEIDNSNGGQRFPVQLSKISPNVIDATIATEDKNFYTDPGVDPLGIARALIQDLSSGSLSQGGSTITQQLAKNVLIARPERTQKTYVRKIQEMVLAFKITQVYSKNDILQMYLDRVYYGHLSYGIEAAAETYFGVHASQLDLAEASMLAGLPQAPSEYDPVVHINAAKQRQAHVLDRMVAQGYITSQQADQAKAEKLTIKSSPDVPFHAPHFVMYVKQLLEQKYGPDVMYDQGLTVTTTLDLNLNRMAQKAIQAHLASLKTLQANNAALVAIDPKTGEILSMVGSRDYYDNSISGEVNMATAPRQTGSTIKPLEYALAFMKGLGPESVVLDTPTAFPNTSPSLPPYQPHNFDYTFDGPMTLRWALANSRNVPAVKVLMYDGIPDFVKFAGELGVHLSDPSQYGLSLGLGADGVSLLDMVGAYAALDNNGVYNPPVAILKITDWQGNVLYQYHPQGGQQVISPDEAYMVTSILSDNWARTPLEGANSPLLLNIPDAAKTGSTDSYKDAWTIGYTPDLTAGVWVGNTNDAPMHEVLGVMGAGYIWQAFMENAHKGKPVQNFVPPPGVQQFNVCQATGQPATAGCPGIVLTEVWPRHYTPAPYVLIPALPGNQSPKDFAGRGVLGQTISPTGVDLQAIPTKRPGQVAATGG